MNDIAKGNYLNIMKAFLIQLCIFSFGASVGLYLIPFKVRQILNIAFILFLIMTVILKNGFLFRTKLGINIYAGILGLLSGSVYIHYLAKLGAELFLLSVFAVIAIFICSYFVALKSTDKHVFKISRFIIPGLIILTMLEIVLAFVMNSSTMMLIVSSLGIILFTADTIVVMKRMQKSISYSLLSTEEVCYFSMEIFLNVLNLLLDILRWLSVLVDND